MYLGTMWCRLELTEETLKTKQRPVTVVNPLVAHDLEAGTTTGSYQETTMLNPLVAHAPATSQLPAEEEHNTSDSIRLLYQEIQPLVRQGVISSLFGTGVAEGQCSSDSAEHTLVVHLALGRPHLSPHPPQDGDTCPETGPTAAGARTPDETGCAADSAAAAATKACLLSLCPACHLRKWMQDLIGPIVDGRESLDQVLPLDLTKLADEWTYPWAGRTDGGGEQCCSQQAKLVWSWLCLEAHCRRHSITGATFAEGSVRTVKINFFKAQIGQLMLVATYLGPDCTSSLELRSFSESRRAFRADSLEETAGVCLGSKTP
ncbi:MAG: hypothetical protein FRX49_08890 [Trebouxia sp. A1-2]|nr:MAG: hypothetical protein FRX49_08890 [Trebouxia sp. A1-2]